MTNVPTEESAVCGNEQMHWWWRMKNERNIPVTITCAHLCKFAARIYLLNQSILLVFVHKVDVVFCVGRTWCEWKANQFVKWKKKRKNNVGGRRMYCRQRHRPHQLLLPHFISNCLLFRRLYYFMPSPWTLILAYILFIQLYHFFIRNANVRCWCRICNCVSVTIYTLYTRTRAPTTYSLHVYTVHTYESIRKDGTGFT